MNQKRFPQEISDCMDFIAENVMIDPDSCEESFVRLDRYATEMRSDYLKGYCLFYRGYQSYARLKLQESMAYLSSALNCLLDVGNWYQSAKAYNAMGNIADFQGDSSLAIDCYIKGLTLCREHDLLLAEHDIQSNLANVYISLNDPGAAMKLLNACEKIADQQSVEIPVASAMVVQANLAMCCIQMGEYEKAETHMERIREHSAAGGNIFDGMSLRMLETELYHVTGKTEKRDEAIQWLQGMVLSSTNIFDALNEFCRHAILLLRLGRMEDFLDLVGRIESLADSPAVEKQVLELWLSYYEAIGDEENYAKMAVKYYKAARAREEEHNRIVCHNIATRIRLGEEEARRKEVEKSNLMLKQKSEHDALTGMNNRYKFNELAELAFHRAYVNGTPLTVEILDIDCYKEFNDNYGHQAGDECLIRIAEAIRSMEEFTGVHTARYGGDEFVLVYENYSKQDVEKMAKRLQERIHSLNIEHKYSKVSDRVTISQGLFHRIPAGGNKTWDFLYGADMALYGVKNRTRNSYYVGTSFDEVRVYSKGKQ